MRFAALSTFAVFGVTAANNYCTPEQFTNLEQAMLTAATTVSPGAYDTVEAYLEASLAAIRQALGGEQAANGYPCFTCFSTYETSSVLFFKSHDTVL